MRRAFWTLATAITIAGAASAQGTAPSASGASSASPTASGSTAPHPGAPPLGIHVQPIFGNEAAVGYGWQDFVVTIENPTPTQQKGNVELRSHMSTYVDRDSFVAKAPFVIVAGKTVSVRLPMRARNDQVPTLTLRVTDEHGTEIAAMPVTPNMNVQPTLVDIDNPSRLAIPLRGWPATTSYSLTPSYTYYTYAPSPTSAMNIAVATPHFDATTGDP
ncbi:MAG TPA: hypothetical protein VGH87_23245, partial [Polyangiaceae bacterium]